MTDETAQALVKRLREVSDLARCVCDGLPQYPCTIDDRVDEAAALLASQAARIAVLERAVDVVMTDESGDLDYVRWYIRENLLRAALYAAPPARESGQETAAEDTDLGHEDCSLCDELRRNNK